MTLGNILSLSIPTLAVYAALTLLSLLTVTATSLVATRRR